MDTIQNMIIKEIVNQTNFKEWGKVERLQKLLETIIDKPDPETEHRLLTLEAENRELRSLWSECEKMCVQLKVRFDEVTALAEKKGYDKAVDYYEKKAVRERFSDKVPSERKTKAKATPEYLL